MAVMHGGISLQELAARLAAEIEAVCAYYLPNGRQDGPFWQVGSVAGEPGNSLRVNLAGRLRGRWKDWANGRDRGDALDLIRAARDLPSIGEAAKEARRFLSLPDAERPAPAVSAAACRPVNRAGLEQVLARSRAIRADDPAGLYLASRGLAVEDARDAGLRFRPDAWVQVDGRKRELPALLAPIRAPDGTLEGLQRIFLAPDGGKAAIADPKRTSGRLDSGAVWWPAADDARHVVLTEGVEDALAVRRALGAHGRRHIAIAAAVSAGRIPQVALPPGTVRVTLAQDRDRAGEEAWAALARVHAGPDVLVGRIVASAKDANDDLLRLGPAGYRRLLLCGGLPA